MLLSVVEDIVVKPLALPVKAKFVLRAGSTDCALSQPRALLSKLGFIIKFVLAVLVLLY